MGSGHSHSHDHDHGYGHGHAHAPADFGNAFLIGIILNTAFVIVEAAYGWISGSMALIADAGHNLSDVLALLLAWGASVAARRPACARFTYGFKSSTILAALANAGLLLVAIGAILFETLHRMAEPAPVQGETMAIVAGIGILVNAGTAALFLRGQHDINIRGAFLHMAADALVSLGVVIAGLLAEGESTAKACRCAGPPAAVPRRYRLPHNSADGTDSPWACAPPKAWCRGSGAGGDHGRQRRADCR